jgi:hypothetical protein
VDVCALFIADSEAPILMEPTESPFDDPARFSQPASMGGSLLSDERAYAALPECSAVCTGTVGSVALHNCRTSQGPTPLAANGRNVLHQGQQLRHVVAVRLRDMDRKGNPLSFGDEMVFGPLFPAIRRVRPRLGPPKTALTEELSMTARLKSILSLPRNLANSTLWIAFQTPCCCQVRRYRQQLIPLPQPSSWGSISHGIPLLRTNTMPVRARRGSIGLRPGCRLRRGFGGGRIRRISSQSASGINSSTFKLSSQLRRAYPISKLSGSHYVRVS